MILNARVATHAGEHRLDVDLSLRGGETTVLLGPNGAGKTTLLRCIAGLHRVDRGRVALDSTVLEDPSTGTRLAPERRALGVVFQDLALFPHMSSQQNAAYGLRARGVRRAEADARALAALSQVGAAHLARRRPADLSGGEAQRVALARALATEPRVLLLDEPLSAIDGPARSALRSDLRAALERFAGVRLVVTHDPVEALLLADRVTVLEAGRVSQEGAAADVAARPRTEYVAALVGINLLRGEARDGALQMAGGVAVALGDDSVTGECLAVVHPHAVSLHRRPPEGSQRNAFRMRVEGIELGMGRARVRLSGPLSLVAELTPASVSDLGLTEGGPIFAAFKATEVTAYPA